jgi:hypothetical protein
MPRERGARGDQTAYASRHGQGSCVVSAGRRSQDFDEIWSLAFSDDASSVSFDAREGPDFWHVVLPLR